MTHPFDTLCARLVERYKDYDFKYDTLTLSQVIAAILGIKAELELEQVAARREEYNAGVGAADHELRASLVTEQLRKRAAEYVAEHGEEVCPTTAEQFAAAIKRQPAFTEAMLADMVRLRDNIMLQGQARWTMHWLKKRAARLFEAYRDRSADVLQKAVDDLSAGKEP